MDGTVGAAQGGSLYEADEHAWMLQQLALIRRGRAAELDLEHLAEYLDAVTRSDRRALKSRLARLLQHILKFDSQPGRATRSWRLTVLEQQRRIRDELQSAPSLRQYVPDLLPEAYVWAREFAAAETGLPESAFPDLCPYTLDEALAWDPPMPGDPPRRPATKAPKTSA